MREPRRALLAVAVFALFCGFSGQMTAQEKGAREIRVAAAADLQPVMPALAAGFEKKTGVKLVVSFGSSSTLAEQIINGAPFDVFLGADFIFPERVVAAGLAASPAPVRYAKGSLVLFARKDSPLQPLHIEELTDARVTRVAVADQFHAPFGRAAYAAIDKLKLTAQVSGKLVVAENVAQTAQYVASGNAQMGFISMTLARSPAMAAVGTYVPVPAVYPEIMQYGVAMKKSAHPDVAKQFLDWMLSPEVQGHLAEFGLEAVR